MRLRRVKSLRRWVDFISHFASAKYFTETEGFDFTVSVSEGFHQKSACLPTPTPGFDLALSSLKDGFLLSFPPLSKNKQSFRKETSFCALINNKYYDSNSLLRTRPIRSQNKSRHHGVHRDVG